MRFPCLSGRTCSDRRCRLERLEKDESNASHELFQVVEKESSRKLRQYIACFRVSVEIFGCNEAGETLLHRAVAAGRIANCRVLIGAGASISAVSKCGWTPLHTAAFYRRSNIVEYLLSLGADPLECDIGYATPLHLACRRRTVRCTKALAEAVVRCLGRRLSIQQHEQAPLMGPTAHLIQQQQQQQQQPQQQQREEEEGSTHAWWHVWSPLHVAAAVRAPHCLRTLLHFAPTACNANEKDSIGRTALHWACMYVYFRAIFRSLTEEELFCCVVCSRFRCFLSQKVWYSDCKPCSDPYPCVYRHGGIECVRVLLAAGASVSLTAANNFTALHFAANGGFRGTCLLLFVFFFLHMFLVTSNLLLL